jgi:hypothetical protein
MKDRIKKEFEGGVTWEVPKKRNWLLKPIMVFRSSQMSKALDDFYKIDLKAIFSSTAEEDFLGKSYRLR